MRDHGHGRLRKDDPMITACTVCVSIGRRGHSVLRFGSVPRFL
jgi:hypothetical protein